MSCDPKIVWTHAQRDPFPGGHTNEVRLIGQDVKRYLERFPLTVSNRLEEGTTNWFLQCIERTWTRNGAPLAWVLNTIDRVEVAEECITIAGVCSPFISSKPAQGVSE